MLGKATVLSIGILMFWASTARSETVEIGSREGAVWDPTTFEAAATDDQKRQLKRGKIATVTGEVIDISCYMQLLKRGEKHVDCGKKCILAGQPIGILDRKGEIYLVIPEEHHPRRDGQISLKERFAELVGKEVEVTGLLAKSRGERALFVKAGTSVPTPAVKP